MTIVRCPHCGTANRVGANFCNGCGTDLRESAPPAAPLDPASAGTPPPPAESAPPPLPIPTTPLPEAADQPWLRLEFGGDEVDVADVIPVGDAPRLITGVQGLLAPMRVATNIGDDDPVTAPPPRPVVDDLSADELRMVRGLMSEAPGRVNQGPPTSPTPLRPLRIPWLFALLGLALGLPALLLAGPQGLPGRWSGVEDAFLTLQGVAPNTHVIVYFAYDAATAGEMDLVMQPVMRHLLRRRAQLTVVSPLPGGPATAERLLLQVRQAARSGNLTAAADLGQPITYAYLPGGSATLPLLARAPAQALTAYRLLEDAPGSVPTSLDGAPGLVVIAAARAEDAQHWLEQVQPLAPTQVIAVTAAGADPPLRPYWDSRQLRGLVSGFDGAVAYQRLLDPFAAPEANPTLLRHVMLQNWGHLALLAALLLGNLAALLSRDPAPS